MATNNAQLFLDNYGGFDYFSICDASADFQIEDALETASFTVTQDGSHKAKIMNQVVPDTATSPRASDLKERNLRLYNALFKAGTSLGGAVLNRGNTTVKYQLFVGEKPMTENMNPAGYSSVGIKFIRQS